MKDILEHYLKIHNKLGAQVDAVDKAVFDVAHRQIWSVCEGKLLKQLSDLEKVAEPTPEVIKEIADLKEWLRIDEKGV